MISERVQRIRPSKTVEITNRVTELQGQGRNLICFNVGEPDFSTPEHICRAAEAAMRQGFTKYTPVAGILELREAISAKLGKENYVQYSSDEITIGAGAKQCILAALLAVLNPGDEVIIPYPCWVSYPDLVKITDGEPVMVPCKEDFTLDISAIREAVTERTKAVMINTPNNPTGAVYSRESLEELAALALEHDFYIISDEVYEKFVYGGRSHVSPSSFSEEVKKHTILINGLSKTYAMTGWRIGYVAADREVIRAMNVLQGQMLSCVQSLSQKAAVAALAGTQEPLQNMIREFESRRDYMRERLNRMPGISCMDAMGAFYLLADVREYYGRSVGDMAIEDDGRMAKYLLEEAGIAVVPGNAFFAPGYVRFSYSNSMEQIEKGMDQMEQALKRLCQNSI